MQKPDILRSLFLADLEEEARKNAWRPEERVLWILDHLDEFIERWLGFVALHISPHALVGSDLFTTMEIAIDALEQEFALNTSFSQDPRLREIRGSLESLRTRGDEKCAIVIKALVAEFRSFTLGDTRSD